MPRFFLHIRNRSGYVEDEEGQELADVTEARLKAIEGIRSLLAEEILNGEVDLRGQIEIADEASAVGVIVHFGEAFELYREGDPA